MLRELARGYQKIGDAQGIRESISLGRPVEAARTYRKAIALLEPLNRGAAPDQQAVFLLARSYCNLGDVLEAIGQQEAAAESFRSCLSGALELDPERFPGPWRTNLLARAHEQVRKYQRPDAAE
jgi:tetratricopeptide (TPR) repeat protein